MKEGKMETAWIQVFVLTLTQCIAPAGKMVCQEEAVEYLFTNENDCASALVTMVDLAARAEDIIVDRQKSNCKPAAKESIVFADSDAAKASLANSDDFHAGCARRASRKPEILRGIEWCCSVQDRCNYSRVCR